MNTETELLKACQNMLRDNHTLGAISRPVADEARSAIKAEERAIQRQRSAILQALMWLDVGADGRARDVLLEALNK